MIGKQRPYEILRSLPGGVVDEAFARSLATSDDLVAGGLATARELIMELLLLDIDGVHLMNFGVPVEAAIDLIQEIRNFPVHADA
jgi:hypothetical protein